MSISSLRESLSDINGAHTLIMSYGRDAEGKEVQVFNIDGKKVQVHCMASVDEIRTALLKAIA